ncbi:hypothetical protein Misp02_05230 [Microtetraspora sp. NBRC 16547]|nr:hypothetical protein Misp02_05230 [Microtetraspora sp. NBRC 16547]
MISGSAHDPAIRSMCTGSEYGDSIHDRVRGSAAWRGATSADVSDIWCMVSGPVPPHLQHAPGTFAAVRPYE